MRSIPAVRALTTFLMMAMLFGSFSADLVRAVVGADTEH